MTSEIETVAANADFGKPSAAKRGRHDRWPYVPVLIIEPTEACPKGYTSQIKGLAFETLAEAVAAAEAHIAEARRILARNLANPGARSLREHYGLPRELTS